MTGWSFFFILIGVSALTAQLFRIVDAIERPPAAPAIGPLPGGTAFPWMVCRS